MLSEIDAKRMLGQVISLETINISCKNFGKRKDSVLPVRILKNYKYYLLGVVEPHLAKNGLGMSIPYKICINKYDMRDKVIKYSYDGKKYIIRDGFTTELRSNYYEPEDKDLLIKNMYPIHSRKLMEYLVSKGFYVLAIRPNKGNQYKDDFLFKNTPELKAEMENYKLLNGVL